MKYNLFVHITATSIIAQFGKPLCGFHRGEFRTGRFYHPDVEIHITSTQGTKMDYQTIGHNICVALQVEGLSARLLRDTIPARKKKAGKVSKEQRSLWELLE